MPELRKLSQDIISGNYGQQETLKFLREKNSLGKVVATAKALWVEALSMRKMDNIKKEPLKNVERAWDSEFLGGTSSTPWTEPRKNSKPQNWQVRMKLQHFNV